MENYRRALENKLDDYNKVVAVRNMMKSKTNIGCTLLGGVELKRKRMIDELIERYKTLVKKYKLECEKANTLYKKNDCFRLNKKKLNEKLQEQETLITNISNTHSTLEKDAQKLQCKLSQINVTIDKLKDMQRQTELKLNDMDQEIIYVKDAIAEKIVQRTKLEKQIDVEWTKYTSLPASQFDRIIKHDHIINSLRTEIATMRNKLDEKINKLTNSKRRFNKTQQQYDIENEQSNEIKANLHHLHGIYEKEKCNTLKKIGSLQENAKELTTKYTLINKNTIYDAQIENGKLKLKLEEQNNTFKELNTNREHLQQEVKRNKQAIELAKQKLLTERKQQLNEMKSHETKLLLKNQEKCELRIIIKDQVRHIKRLKMEINAIKRTAVPQSS